MAATQKPTGGRILERYLRLVLPLILLALTACAPAMYRESRLAMSTTLTILVSGGPKPDWQALFAFADRSAWQFDHRHPDSAVGRLNREGRLTGPLPPGVLDTLNLARSVATLSRGAFDPTILPLTAVWSFDTGGRLPSPEEIAAVRPRVDYTRLSIGTDGTVTLPPGFGLDLGGIAKGAVVDLLGAELERRGYRRYLIDAGGDILVSGLKDGRRPWSIAIRHPRDSQGIVGVLALGGEGRVAVVTSGDYERYFEVNGRRYHHIIDPHTGYPAQGLVSVTVIAPSCAMADALATAAFVLGPEQGLKLLESLQPGDSVEGLLIAEHDGRLSGGRTSGFPLAIEALTLRSGGP
jgi:thiamine biosynthesis lipoprotein